MINLFKDNFSKAELITNEYAFFNPNAADAIKSPFWEMTSGSLFLKDDRAWTGIPDDKDPDAKSIVATDSQIFRLTTKRADFLTHLTSFTLNVDHYVSSPNVPAVDWDGIHIFMRYQTEETLYYVSVCRRDGAVVIKKKVSTKLLDAQKIKYVASDVSNGGVYYQISTTAKNIFVLQKDMEVAASIQTIGNTVKITALVNGFTIVTAIDDGKMGGTPILTAGKTGIRADNVDATFDSFSVDSLS